MPSSSYCESLDESRALLKEDKSRLVHYESFGDSVSDEDDDQDEETAILIPTAKYWYRWYICGIFALFGMLQGAVWNTWGPIDKSVLCAFGFKSSEVDLLTNWGPIFFIPSMPIFMWLLDKRGLRLPSVLSAALVAVGTALRCLPLPVHILRYFMHVGQMFNAVAGCAVMAAPVLLSNAWFPPQERVTATSVTTLFNYLGTGFAYIIGPLIVQQPWGNSTNNSSSPDNFSIEVVCNGTNEQHIIRKEIMNLMYTEFGICMLIFLSMLAFFPSHPPKPPSASASIGRMEFFAGVKALRFKRTFLVVTLTFAMALGGYGGWMGVLSIVLNDVNVTQDEAGKVGFFMTLVGCAVGMLVGWFADRCKGRIKLMIIVLFSIAFLAFLYYINMTQQWITVRGFKFSQVGLWFTCIIIGITMNAAVPLGMEMGADAAYPTSEAVSASVIVWFFNLLSFVLLLTQQFTDAQLTNYLMLAFIGLSIPLLIFFSKEPSNRMNIDMTNSVEVTGKTRNRAPDLNVNFANGRVPDFGNENAWTATS